MSRDVNRNTAVQIVDDHGLPGAVSMVDIRRLVREVTGRDVTYRLVRGLAHQDVHGLWAGYDDGTAVVSYPPAPSGTQLVVINHEHGHMLISPDGPEEPHGVDPRLASFVERTVDGIVPGRRVVRSGQTLEQEYVPDLEFLYGHTDFTADEERLAELVGVELSVRVMRHARARGRDVQFGRVFGG
jgi:hypothetical protein